MRLHRSGTGSIEHDAFCGKRKFQRTLALDFKGDGLFDKTDVDTCEPLERLFSFLGHTREYIKGSDPNRENGSPDQPKAGLDSSS